MKSKYDGSDTRLKHSSIWIYNLWNLLADVRNQGKNNCRMYRRILNEDTFAGSTIKNQATFFIPQVDSVSKISTQGKPVEIVGWWSVVLATLILLYAVWLKLDNMSRPPVSNSMVKKRSFLYFVLVIQNYSERRVKFIVLSKVLKHEIYKTF